jgi:hypothetical protein
MSAPLRIRILDDVIEVPAGDSILRALQIYSIARQLPAYGFARFCWNARCQQCLLDFTLASRRRRRAYACQTEAVDGMHILSLPAVLNWKNRLPAPR